MVDDQVVDAQLAGDGPDFSMPSLRALTAS
jgi:hypothetical protein